MVGLASGVFDGCQDILALEGRVVRENLLEGRSCRQQIQDVRDTDPQSPDARAPSALPFFYGDPLQTFSIHWLRV